LIVTKQTVTVYKGGRRRCFSRWAAYRNAAKAKMRERCECYHGSDSTIDPTELCKHHYGNVGIRIDRLARFYSYLDSKTEEASRG
jgi:hypothetical protein